MIFLRDEASQSGVKLTSEDFSREVLGVGKKKKYLRGFGVGPMSSQSSKSGLASQAHDEEMEKLRADLDEQNREREKECEEQHKKFEEQEKKIEEQQLKFEEQQRRFEEQQRQFQEQQKQMVCLQNMVGLLLQDRQDGHST